MWFWPRAIKMKDLSYTFFRTILGFWLLKPTFLVSTCLNPTFFNIVLVPSSEITRMTIRLPIESSIPLNIYFIGRFSPAMAMT